MLGLTCGKACHCKCVKDKLESHLILLFYVVHFQNVQNLLSPATKCSISTKFSFWHAEAAYLMSTEGLNDMNVWGSEFAVRYRWNRHRRKGQKTCSGMLLVLEAWIFRGHQNQKRKKKGQAGQKEP